MSDSLIERMAKAMWEEQERLLGSNTPWEEANEETGKGFCMRFVRAVLVAMREPTQKVHYEGDCQSMRHQGDAGKIWEAMIDAALEEK